MTVIHRRFKRESGEAGRGGAEPFPETAAAIREPKRLRLLPACRTTQRRGAAAAAAIIRRMECE